MRSREIDFAVNLTADDLQRWDAPLESPGIGSEQAADKIETEHDVPKNLNEDELSS